LLQQDKIKIELGKTGILVSLFPPQSSVCIELGIDGNVLIEQLTQLRYNKELERVGRFIKE
jgi:hypothetical protein